MNSGVPAGDNVDPLIILPSLPYCAFCVVGRLLLFCAY